MLAAIDPGEDQGWSVFDDDSRLVACGLGPLPARYTIQRAVVEKPMIYPGGRQRANPADVITLAVRAGEAGGTLRLGGAEVTYVEPARWKGSVSKDISHARIWAKLAPSEQTVVATSCRNLAPGKRHNVMDAVGLGLFAAGR
jgi:hypothetical protein